MKKSRTPQIAFVDVTAALFGAINDLRDLFCRNGERGIALAKFHPQWGQAASAGGLNFIAIANRNEFVGTGCSGIDRRFVVAKMKRRSQLQSWTRVAGKHAIGHVDGVLQMRKDDSLFQNEVTNVIGPNRKAIFQSEFAQKICARQIEPASGTFFRA